MPLPLPTEMVLLQLMQAFLENNSCPQHCHRRHNCTLSSLMFGEKQCVCCTYSYHAHNSFYNSAISDTTIAVT